jgi:hypothetical protein
MASLVQPPAGCFFQAHCSSSARNAASRCSSAATT